MWPQPPSTWMRSAPCGQGELLLSTSVLAGGPHCSTYLLRAKLGACIEHNLGSYHAFPVLLTCYTESEWVVGAALVCGFPCG